MATASARKAAAIGRGPDAVAMLKADHKQVKDWFEEFEKSRSEKKKQTLATNICRALTVHCAKELQARRWRP